MAFELKGIFRDIKKKVGELTRKVKTEENPVEEGAKTVRLSDEAYALLQTLAKELGPRASASSSSRISARKIATEMGKDGEDVTMTGGRVYPSVVKDMIFFSYILTLLVILFTFIGMSYISVILIALYLYSLYAEVVKGNGWLRKFMKADDAANVHSVLEPKEHVVRTVIFSAHHDSAHIKEERKGIFWKIAGSKYLQIGALSLAAFVSVVMLVIELADSILARPGIAPLLVSMFLFIALAASVISFIAFVGKDEEISLGAGDNLSGVAVVLTLLSYFAKEKREGRGLKHTRLVFVSFDGEECGAAGSKLWYRDNSHLFVNASNLNFDGIYKEDYLVFLSTDGNGLIPLSPALASRCSNIAAAMGYKIPVGRLGLFGGETDAASAARFGINATTLTGMAPGSENPAHSREDTPDKVSDEALGRAIAIGIRLAVSEDEKESEKNEAEKILEEGRRYKLSRYDT